MIPSIAENRFERFLVHYSIETIFYDGSANLSCVLTQNRVRNTAQVGKISMNFFFQFSFSLSDVGGSSLSREFWCSDVE